MFPLNFTTFSHKIYPNEFQQHFHNHRHWHRHLPTDHYIIPETSRPGRSVSPSFVVIMSRVVHLNFSFIEEKSLPRIWNGPYCRRSCLWVQENSKTKEGNLTPTHDDDSVLPRMLLRLSQTVACGGADFVVRQRRHSYNNHQPPSIWTTLKILPLDQIIPITSIWKWMLCHIKFNSHSAARQAKKGAVTGGVEVHNSNWCNVIKIK